MEVKVKHGEMLILSSVDPTETRVLQVFVTYLINHSNFFAYPPLNFALVS